MKDAGKLSIWLLILSIIGLLLAIGDNSVQPVTNPPPREFKSLSLPRSPQIEFARSQPINFELRAAALAPLDFYSQSSIPTHRETVVQVSNSYGKLPLHFETNAGQADPRVKFLSRGNGYMLFLTSTEIVVRIQKPKVRQPETRSDKIKKHGVSARTSDSEETPTVIRMKLQGANADTKIVGIDELRGRSNYFSGNDPVKWRTRVPHYAKVTYKEVYPGVDLVFYGNQRQLEFDFVVAPGANPEAINFLLEGADKTEFDNSGRLVLSTGHGPIQLGKPLMYQETNGVKQEIEGRYVLNSKPQSKDENSKSFSFDVAAYDRTKPLIIDPILYYATYLGGTGFDSAYSIAVDSIGNAYVTGVTNSPDFPAANGAQVRTSSYDDVFVMKLNPAGTEIIYSTYLGGDAYDEGYGIAVDSLGNALVTGSTSSSDFPTTSGAFSETTGTPSTAFVTKLSSDGSTLIYSTYLGGTNSDGGSGGSAIAVDVSGYAYITGTTTSIDFPTTEDAFDRTCGYDGKCDRVHLPGTCWSFPYDPNACTVPTSDAFVVKLNPQGSALVYSTFLGGESGDGGAAIAIDSQGNAYVTGSTDSYGFPTENAFQTTKSPRYTGDPCRWFDTCPDAFIAKLNPQGSALIYSTYLGGHGDDYGTSIAVDSSGNAYVTGTTRAADFPTTPESFQPTSCCVNISTAFVTKWSPTGGLIYSTFLGTVSRGTGIAVDSLGNAYMTGSTGSIGLPIVNPVSPGGGRQDSFVTKINADGTAVLFSSYLGGNLDDFANGIAVNSAGDIYVAGTTKSTDFATLNALQTSLADASGDAFVVSIRSNFIDITDPRDGDVWPVGSTQTIRWNAADIAGNVNVQLSRNGGSSWTNLFRSKVDIGSRSWKVKGPGTPSAKVRVCSRRSPSVCNVSDATFAITPYMDVVSPNGGEIWSQGTTQTIRWNADSSVPNVTIEISRNGGSQWTTLFSSVPNTGAQSWVVSGPATARSRVRVRNAASSTTADVSNANFTIQ